MKAAKALSAALLLCSACAVVVVDGDCTARAVVLSQSKVTCVREGDRLSVQVEGAHVSEEFMAPVVALAQAVASFLRHLAGAPAEPQPAPSTAAQLAWDRV